MFIIEFEFDLIELDCWIEVNELMVFVLMLDVIFILGWKFRLYNGFIVVWLILGKNKFDLIDSEIVDLRLEIFFDWVFNKK